MSEIPEKWRDLTWEKLNGRIPEFIEDMRQAKTFIGLCDTPANPKTMEAFFKMFECERCGECCIHMVEQGIILVPGDLDRMADHLKVSKHWFKDKYTFIRDGNRFMNHPCPFFELKSCIIHEARPQVCRMFPVNQPIRNEKGDFVLCVNSFCPAGRKTAEKILNYQVSYMLTNCQ